MPALIVTIIGVVVGMLIMDVLMWMLFSRKVRPLCFPSDAKTQCFKRLRLSYLRIFTVAHLIITAGISTLALLLLW